jgi:uncharacterized protein (DUF736 family)
MSTIGLVRKKDDGSYEGRLKTLTINTSIRITPVKEKMKPSHPDFRISLGKGMDAGAAWKKITRTGKNKGKEYISCSVSAPELGTVYFNLGRAADQDEDDVFALIWNEKQEQEEAVE